VIPLIIGHLKAIIEYATAEGLTRGTYVAVYIRNSHEALRGRRPAEVEIVYVDGADMVLDQPGVRTYVSSLVGLGAREKVAG
jgi:hypothetical protein